MFVESLLLLKGHSRSHVTCKALCLFQTKTHSNCSKIDIVIIIHKYKSNSGMDLSLNCCKHVNCVILDLISIRVESKYTFWDLIQIHLSQIKYIAFLDFNSNKKLNSNTLPFLKCYSNTIQIHGSCFHYSSSVSQLVEF